MRTSDKVEFSKNCSKLPTLDKNRPEKSTKSRSQFTFDLVNIPKLYAVDFLM